MAPDDSEAPSQQVPEADLLDCYRLALDFGWSVARRAYGEIPAQAADEGD